MSALAFNSIESGNVSLGIRLSRVPPKRAVEQKRTHKVASFWVGHSERQPAQSWMSKAQDCIVVVKAAIPAWAVYSGYYFFLVSCEFCRYARQKIGATIGAFRNQLVKLLGIKS